MNKLLLGLSVVLSGAALTLSLISPSTPVAAPPAPSASSDELQELAFRVQLLEEAHRDLSQKVSLLSRPAGQPEGAPTVAHPTVAPAPGVEQELAQLRSEVRAMMVGEVMTSDQGRTVLKDMVRSVQTELASEQRAQRQQQFQQAQAQAAVERQQRWQRFMAEARLTYAQEQELKRRLEAEEAARRELLAGPGGARAGDFREAMRALRAQREETDKVMRDALDGQQRAQYDELRRQDFGGRGGRGESSRTR